MATPHVAGAAALVAQQHPDWVAGDLKNALTGSARPNPAIGLFGQGSGRVDVARAVGQTVRASVSSLSLGSRAWPADDDTPVVRTVTYRNDGSADVTLDLSSPVTGPDGKPAPAGMFTVSPSQVTVPAGGAADVVLTADTRVASVTGLFTGAVVATSGAWTFRSAEAPTDSVTYLPVSNFAFSPELDIDNSAHGGIPYLVPVSLKRQPGATPRSGGSRSRCPMTTAPRGGRRRCCTSAARTGWRTCTTLGRARCPCEAATFADGGTVDHTVIDAYQLR